MNEHIVIQKIINENIYIGLQPARSPEDAVVKPITTLTIRRLIHVAFYKWIDKIFKADAVIHMGTHGTLRMASGEREIALSKESYPDINILLYPASLYL